MWPGNSVLIIINALVPLVYSLPPNIDWSNLQYDPDSVAQNENILKLFLQLAVHTANRLMHLRNETDRDYDCNGRNDNRLPSITEASITQSLSQANLERPDKNQDRIQNRLFINNSEINNNDRVLLENLDQDQTTLFYSTQSQELFDNSSNFEEGTDIARDSKTNNLIPTLVQNVQNTSSDVVRRNYDVRNYDIRNDTSQKLINSNTTNNVLNTDEFNSNAQDSQNSTIDGISERLFNSIDLIKNISNATITNDLTETVHKFLPKSQNVRESTPEVSQRLFGVDLAKIVPGTKIVNDLHENVNQLNNRRSQNTQEQSDRNNGVSPRYLDSTMLKNFENILNPQIVNNLPVVNQILSNAKNFVESMIKVLPETESAENGNNFLNHIISQSQNVINAKTIKKNPTNFNYIQHQQIRNVKQIGDKFDDNLIHNQNFNDNSENDVNEPDDASKGNNKKTENNNLSIITDNSKAENSDSQSPAINERLSIGNDRKINKIDEVIKPKAFEKTDKIRTNYTNEQLNPISKNLSQRNETNELLKDFAVEGSLNQLESDASRISSITEYQSKNSSSTQAGLQDSENVSKSNVEKSKELQDNPSTNIRISRSIGNPSSNVVSNSELDSNHRVSI
ncbi:unnamed protein product [Lasius platythorax]|uniref:Uncharacterized protein n=1 Tax=Lasius platythorax TaxID=488582 RepID=A0AAV2NND1_9HYME